MKLRCFYSCLAKGVLSVVFACFATGKANSAIALDGINPYTQNFDSLASSGTASTLPNGWAFTETDSNANTTYTAGTGSGNTGDTYSFGSASGTDRALGGLQSGNLIPIFGAEFVNDTGGIITSLSIQYTGEQWRLGAVGRVDCLDFQYSLNANSLTSGTWVDFNALDFIAPTQVGTVGALDGNASANRQLIAATISNLSVLNGQALWIRWTDFNATGSDDGLAVDEFSITASFVAVPEPSTFIAGALLLFPFGVHTFRYLRRRYSV